MEVPGQPARRSSAIDRDLRELGERLGILLGRLDEMSRRLGQLDELVDTMRRYGSLTDTVAQTAADTSRRMTNLEQGVDSRLVALERYAERGQRWQQLLHLEEMAPREIEQFPGAMRQHLDREEERESLEERFERRMRIAVVYATVFNAIFAGLAVLVAYWLGHH